MIQLSSIPQQFKTIKDYRTKISYIYSQIVGHGLSSCQIDCVCVSNLNPEKGIIITPAILAGWHTMEQVFSVQTVLILNRKGEGMGKGHLMLLYFHSDR